jgi:hypothetical protein
MLKLRQEVRGDWRKLHNKEHYALYASQNIIRVKKSRRQRSAGLVARIGERGDACRVLLRTSEGRKLLGRPRHRWEDNIKTDL